MARRKEAPAARRPAKAATDANAEIAALKRELRESLDREAATGEVLRVIASSPSSVDAVLQAIAENAARLCDSPQVVIFRVADGTLTFAATHGSLISGLVEAQAKVPINALTPSGRAILERRSIHIPDYAAVAGEYPDALTVRHGLSATMRSLLATPLVRDDAAIGAIVVFRTEMRPFTAREIALVESFAAQAVIAIENARLVIELRESLKQQTATADVLKVMSRSTFDLHRVLEALLETAARLCLAEEGFVFRREGDVYRVSASYGYAPDYEAWMQRQTIVPGRDSLAGRTALEGRTVHIPDVLADPEYGWAESRRRGNYRAMLGVPLLRSGEGIGIMGFTRAEPIPFTDKQIELVEGFAAQAVIAIENARLLEELNTRNHDLAESLDHQTATSEVLRTIASSPGDADRVLETIARTAHRLFRAAGSTIARIDGEVFRGVAATGQPGGSVQASLSGRRVDRDTVPGRAVLERRTIHIEDMRQQTAEFPRAVSTLHDTGIRTLLVTPLMREGEPIGTISVRRQEVRPFTAKEIELLESFADQAVIAIENARLLAELRERTEELAQRQAELRVTFDNMGDGVVMFDERLRLAAWNANLQQILAIPDAFLAEPRTYREYISFLTERGEFGDADAAAEMQRYEEDIARRARFERTRPDGRVLEVRRNPVPGGGFVLIYGDITERKRAEEQVRAARDAAERALEDLKTAQASLVQAEKMASLGQLTAGIAHEIKNPLNFVNNFAALSVELLDELKETAGSALVALDPERRGEIEEVVGMLTGNLEKIAEHGGRADGIVKSMLAHSRGGSGERQSVDLNALVEDSLNLAYHGARAQDQDFNVTLERDLDPSVAPIEVVPQELTRVLLNLFANGFYAADKRRREAGDPAFGASLKVTTRDDGGDVVIRIRDNGVGIPAENRARLFEPFFTTKPTGEGTGLGLSISYDIVTQQHGGTIAVDSEPGAFTEFSVTLPRRAGAADRSVAE